MQTIYDENGVTIYHADMLTVELPTPPDIIITSPPYNLKIPYDVYDDNLPYNEYIDFTARYLRHLRAQARDHTRLCINVPVEIKSGADCHSALAAEVCKQAENAGWRFRHCIAWDKDQVKRRSMLGSFRSPSAPLVQIPIEFILVFYAADWRRDGAPQTMTGAEYMEYVYGLWRITPHSSALHPAVFPIELPRRLLKLFSFPDDVVYDPFCGIGTTLLAAQQLGRRAYGCDISARYCNIAAMRCAQKMLFDEDVKSEVEK